jgi:site-specific DNA recombinase
MTKHIAIYTRVSPGARTQAGVRNTDDAVSLEVQEQRCRARIEADALPGKVVVYRDEFESSRSMDRTAFKKLWIDVRFGLVSHVYFLRLDRLTGSGLDIHKIIEECGERDVKLVSVDEAFDTSTDAGQLVVKMLSIMREHQLKMGRRRTSEVLQHKKAIGQKWNGSAPYGCKWVADESGQEWVAPAEKEIECLQAALYWLEHRGLTYRETADRLNVEGYRTRTGKKWTTSKVYQMTRRGGEDHG